MNIISNHNYISILLKLVRHSNWQEVLDCIAQLFICNGIEVNSDYKFLSDKEKE